MFQPAFRCAQQLKAGRNTQHPTFLHEFEAKKLDVGEWKKWIELSLTFAQQILYDKSTPGLNGQVKWKMFTPSF